MPAALALANTPLPGPWARALGDAPPDVRWTYRFPLDVPLERAWEVLVDTSELNCAIGLARFDALERGGVAQAVQRHLGVTYAWSEPPWAWVDGSHVDAMRLYSRGPARAAVIRYGLAPHPRGSEVAIELAFWVPSPIARALLRIAGVTFRLRYARGLARLIAARRGNVAHPPSVAGRTLPAESRLDETTRTARESGADEKALLALRAHVERGEDHDVVRIRPRVLAREQSLSERDVLLACLHATRAGMLELVWDVICPHCRGARRSLRSLGDVPGVGRCDPCGIDFTTAAEHAIEVTFRPSPSVRDVRERWHCIAEAATRRHVRVQQPLAAGESRAVQTQLARGAYRLRLRGEHEARDVRVERGGPAAVEVRASEQEPVLCAPSATLTLVADRARDELFVIEDPRWPDDALRPAMLFNLQAFRDLFASEYLAADVQLAVGQQAILFTDLVGSTRMYAERGDARAFADVKRHFALVYEAVTACDGAVVKTIGDAAMASFFRPADALRAAARMIRDLAAQPGLGLEMRISIHVGTCIAVHLNSGIDYFGQTVNVAAKLQACVEARQVVFPASLLDDPAVAALLDSEHAQLERLAHRIPALDTTVEVVRWTLR